MKHYIDKDVLVAELKKKISDYWSDSENTMGIYPYALEEVIKYTDTLEVKEVDLEVELANYNREYVDENDFFNTEHLAKHFFELGIKAQHDNWKVVDNKNLPQADRNKIYCVFTKQRYILAKVIDHPQDDGLLQ